VDDAPQVCSVAVVVPHPTTTAVLCMAGLGFRLPLLDVVCETPGDPTAVDLVRALSLAFDQPVVLLRTIAVAWAENFDVTEMVVEIDALGVHPPAGCAWADVEPGLDGTSVEPAWAVPTFFAWLPERLGGWSARRPAWSRPGWFAEASAWITEQMRACGFRDPEPPRIHQLWGLSVVISAGSRDGTAFFKCSGEWFRSEPTLTRALASTSPSCFPEVLAVEAERGWLLMRDFGGRLLGDQPTTAWGAGLDALATVQRSWLGRTDELLAAGAAARPLEDLASWVADLDVEPDLLQACLRLAELSPGPTLVHGDLHPWNVAATDHGPLLFDWTDAAVSHPFLDLATYVTRTPHVDVRHHLTDRYLAHWDDLIAPAELAEAGRLALVVGSLYQARSYSQIVPTLHPADLGELADGEADWLARAVRRLKVGLHAGY
jgi:hypothetical protein